jgi:hypothetical protein
MNESMSAESGSRRKEMSRLRPPDVIQVATVSTAVWRPSVRNGMRRV